jgi:hypothetical protein
MKDSRHAFFFAVKGRVPTRGVIWGIELLFGKVGDIIDGEVVGDGGENYYGAQQKGGEQT